VTADSSAQKLVKIALADMRPTWTDPATGLMWARKDNGFDVDWNQANNYCANLKLGEYSGWRLPSINELTSLFSPDVTNTSYGFGHIKEPIFMSGGGGGTWTGSAGYASGEMLYFRFADGGRASYPFSYIERAYAFRALCVHPSVAP
jgi:hypothetical protein